MAFIPQNNSSFVRPNAALLIDEGAPRHTTVARVMPTLPQGTKAVAPSTQPFDLDQEFKMQNTIKELIKKDLINAAHDVADGGLYVTLVEMSLNRNLGFEIVTDSEIREDAFLFGEGQGRVVVTVTEDEEDEFLEHMIDSKVNLTLLGHVTKGKMVVDDDHYGFVNEAKDVYENALGKILEN